MRDRSMGSGTELAREIQLTDKPTERGQGKLVFVVSTKPSLAQFISLFTTGTNCLSMVQTTDQLKFFYFKISVKKKRRKEIRFDKLNKIEKTCLTCPLEYKCRMIFELVLGVIITLRSAVG